MISFAERTPSHSMTSMAPIITIGISQARCFSEANCSSSNGTEPVSRTRTPCAGVELQAGGDLADGVVWD